MRGMIEILKHKGNDATSNLGSAYHAGQDEPVDTEEQALRIELEEKLTADLAVAKHAF